MSSSRILIPLSSEAVSMVNVTEEARRFAGSASMAPETFFVSASISSIVSSR